MIRRALLAMLSMAASAGAQQAPADSTSRWVDSIFAPYASRKAPGCAVGITKDGTLSFAKGYGMADLEHDTPITPETRFYLASISKQFTAMSIVLLEQQHRLSLDDSIQKWVPEVPSFGTTITLRHLLHHTSGLRDYFTLLAVQGWPSDGLLTEEQFLSLVGRQKSLNFTPGNEFLYSNTGYVLLSIVVKRASGQSLRDFAAERIFKPLGMTHTEFRDNHTALIPNRAQGYEPTAGTFRVSEPEFDVVGDGGAYSTIDDLAKWDANFRTPIVGGQEAIALLQEPGQLNDGQEIQYALALTIGRFRGVKTYSHSGSYAGYRSTLLRLPEKGESVITLCNTASASPTLADQVGSVLVGLSAQATTAATIDLSTNLWSAGGAQAPYDSIGARRRNAELVHVAGNYYSDELELPVTLAAREGVLVLQRPHADDIRFVAFTDDLFTNSDKMLLRVLRDKAGQVSGFTLTISRVRDLEFTRRSGAEPRF
ncbi:MAG TPA: serine hydrolase domain-containing protein [Gemmatimonadaceae bacterium]|nr:serine hydrolase domain-containing protein [Gemmatimonadaceae bacterium]